MTQTYYTILSIPQSLPPTHKNYQSLLKKSYHRTLLRCHPDKLPAGTSSSIAGQTKQKQNVGGEEEENGNDGGEIYTIDQINTAYKTLSSPTLRQEYDLFLRSSVSNGTNGGAGGGGRGGYKTGLDVVDLDDMAYHPPDEEEAEGSQGGRFTKSCRCGAGEGYVLTEEDMDDVEKELQQQQQGTNHGTKARSMIIGCLGCSLWVQVDWVVCDSDDEGGE
ncbi:Diphthamide biosynthesis protein 4 [Orbilia oligospora]|uniref:Diphthamide biosynthesis protein 4 n=1 Tax=Orbilia oligospora TaxID=2813651 RepID=A0A6G1M9L9_ORBOL|nr:Diphthamide biosynthesis protein 4 [Orbilia oligospora]KAF3225178.1 Diphthamide biosynthesis protein 4 [Orbilia oligospora]KAF3249163.1 Diphthamide biosynthesis protein 4 [Orbilia oligospora]